MNDAFDIRGESHIEVHKFRVGAIIIATLMALVIQTWTPVRQDFFLAWPSVSRKIA